MSLLVVGLDTTVLNVALPTLVGELGASTSQLQWIVDSYALMSGSLVLFCGSLADRLGRWGHPRPEAGGGSSCPAWRCSRRRPSSPRTPGPSPHWFSRAEPWASARR
ncbi:MFS transporter [Streptomyces sp. KR55]|uniref:MFS transporter n=1 Tax=Streptomyces sp. KR55 TaxID=3457425 RepID=UPI003FD57231